MDLIAELLEHDVFVILNGYGLGRGRPFALLEIIQTLCFFHFGSVSIMPREHGTRSEVAGIFALHLFAQILKFSDLLGMDDLNMLEMHICPMNEFVFLVFVFKRNICSPMLNNLNRTHNAHII